MDIKNALEDCAIGNIPKIGALLDLGKLLMMNMKEAQASDMLWALLSSIRAELQTVGAVVDETCKAVNA